jgi:RimJ/RimL family protein N-acetyltransferase
MPRSAPPAEITTQRTPAQSESERAERARDARELAVMETQLGALSRDIHVGRRAARHAAAAKGLGLFSHDGRRAPRPHGERIRLRDGATIVIRQVEPEDASQLKIGFEHLGAVSRYRRFLTPIEDLSPRQLAYLTHVDHVSHEAIAALDAVTGAGIGIARYVRDPDDPEQAEVAIVVADAWQGRGVGTALMERLAARGRAAGVERITARMLVGNDAARAMIERVADILGEAREAGTISLTARLRRPGSGGGESPPAAPGRRRRPRRLAPR